MSPKPYDTAYYDLLNMQCLSTKNLFFYSSGAEAGRYDKVKFILIIILLKSICRYAISAILIAGNVKSVYVP